MSPNIKRLDLKVERQNDNHKLQNIDNSTVFTDFPNIIQGKLCLKRAQGTTLMYLP